MLVREDHHSDSRLDTPIPYSHVNAAVCPPHDTVTATFVIFVITCVSVSTFPHEVPNTVLLVVSVLTLISVALLATISLWSPLPFSLPLFLAILKAARVRATVSPLILAESMRFTKFVLPDVLISIVKEIAAVAMSQIIEPLALVFVFIFPNMNPKPRSFAFAPLSDV